MRESITWIWVSQNYIMLNLWVHPSVFWTHLLLWSFKSFTFRTGVQLRRCTEVKDWEEKRVLRLRAAARRRLGGLQIDGLGVQRLRLSVEVPWLSNLNNHNYICYLGLFKPCHIKQVVHRFNSWVFNAPSFPFKTHFVMFCWAEHSSGLIECFTQCLNKKCFLISTTKKTVHHF